MEFSPCGYISLDYGNVNKFLHPGSSIVYHNFRAQQNYTEIAVEVNKFKIASESISHKFGQCSSSASKEVLSSKKSSAGPMPLQADSKRALHLFSAQSICHPSVCAHSVNIHIFLWNIFLWNRACLFSGQGTVCFSELCLLIICSNWGKMELPGTETVKIVSLIRREIGSLALIGDLSKVYQLQLIAGSIWIEYKWPQYCK